MKKLRLDDQYIIKGQKLARVTNISKLVDEMGGLIGWAAGVGFDAFNNGFNSGYEAYKDAIETAQNYGSQVHHEIDYAIKQKKFNLEESPVELRSSLTAFKKFTGAYKINPIFSEEILYSLELGIAGTADLVCELNGKLTILDWKTSGGFYPGHIVQMAGYDILLRKGECCIPREVDQYCVLRLPKDDKPYEALIISDNKEKEMLRQVFFKCLDLANVKAGLKDIMKSAQKNLRENLKDRKNDKKT